MPGSNAAHRRPDDRRDERVPGVNEQALSDLDVWIRRRFALGHSSGPGAGPARPALLYIVPRFTFTPLAAAAAQNNLFVYPQFEVDKAWARGRTSATASVTYWAVANDAPWPLAESVVTVVRTSLMDSVRRPVDEQGKASAKKD